jgi:hypothetical protein
MIIHIMSLENSWTQTWLRKNFRELYHIYQYKTYVKGRAVVSSQIWSKSTTAEALIRIGEGLFIAEVSACKRQLLYQDN